MATDRRQVELLEKNKPRQARAIRTYEAILAAAAELLVEVGVERISTNLIAERAGVTVPALYRYFPNKYAVLNALGAVMMDRQNAVFDHWFETHIQHGDPQVLLANIYDLLKQTYDVTVAQTGGLEIIQSLRAVAPLQAVRLTSHRLVASNFAALLPELLGRPEDQSMVLQARLTVDMGYAVVEMALEDDQLAPEQTLREGARLIQFYWQGILGPAQTV